MIYCVLGKFASNPPSLSSMQLLSLGPTVYWIGLGRRTVNGTY